MKQSLSIKDLEVGDVLLVNSSTIYNRLVRYATSSYWGHAVLFMGNDCMIEADQKGVFMKTLRTLEKSNSIGVYRHIKSVKNIRKDIVANALTCENKGYDFLAILNLAWMIITGRRKEMIRSGDRNRFTCSEMVAFAYHMSGIEVREGITYDNVIPADFDLSENFTKVGYLTLS